MTTCDTMQRLGFMRCIGTAAFLVCFSLPIEIFRLSDCAPRARVSTLGSMLRRATPAMNALLTPLKLPPSLEGKCSTWNTSVDKLRGSKCRKMKINDDDVIGHARQQPGQLG